MKKIGYLIFAVFFSFFRLFPRKKNKVFCIMTHDGSDGSSVGVVVQALKQRNEKYEFHYLKKEERESVKQHKLTQFLSFFLVKPYHLATSSVVMLDNVFLPMAYLKFAKDVKVVQLWHGTGTIKKFGQDVNTGELKELEKRANSTITHLVVNSEYTKEQYSHAFGLEKSRIFSWGLPRTDEMFSEEITKKKTEHFYQKFPELKDKKLVLYAPTFRDDEVNEPKLCLDLEKLMKETDSNTVYLLKLHPFVAANFNIEGISSERVKNISFYQDINTLLMVSDVLITDYSSIIFEYCVLEKPMIFYAYDLEKFSKQGRGFYEPYKEYVPGPIARTTEDIIQILNKNSYDFERIVLFKKKSYQYLDGQAINRLIKNIFE